MACLCAASFLPYGRFYNRLGGNVGMLASDIYIFMYLTFNFLRRSTLLDLFLFRAIHKLGGLKYRLARYLHPVFPNNNLYK